MNKKGWVFGLMLLVFGVSGAQVNDAGLWFSASVEKKINLQMSVQLTQGLRMYENITEVGQTFTELGFSYLIKKGFTASVMYRFSQSKQIDNNYSLRHRAALDLAYKYKYKRAIFMIRERVQVQYRNVGTSETGSVPRIYARTKFTFKYDCKKKLTPYIAVEMFNPLNNPKRMWIDRMRYRVGLEYDINKHHSLDFYYQIDQQLYRKNPRRDFVGGISYQYTF